MSRVARYVVTGGVMDLTIYIALSLAPLLAVQWHLRKLDLALLPLSWGVVYSLTAIFGGRLSDRISRTGSMRGGLVLFILSCGIFFTADAGRVWLLYLGMPVVALAMALFWPALQAAIADESGPRDLTRNLGWFNVTWGVGKGLGVVAGGALLELMGRGGFLVAAGIGVLLLFLLPRVPRGGGLGSPVTADAERYPARTRRRFWVAALIGNFAAFGLGTTIINLYPEWHQVVAGRSGFEFGLLAGGVFLAQTLAFAVLLRWPGWHYRRWPHLVPQLLGGAAALLFVSGLPLLALLPFVLAVGSGLGIAYYASIYYSLHADTGRGRRAGLHESILGVGNWLVPLLAGALAEAASSEAVPLLFAGGVVIAATLVQAVVLRR